MGSTRKERSLIKSAAVAEKAVVLSPIAVKLKIKSYYCNTYKSVQDTALPNSMLIELHLLHLNKYRKKSQALSATMLNTDCG